MPTLSAKYRIEISTSIPIRVPGSIFKSTEDSEATLDPSEVDYADGPGVRHLVAAPYALHLDLHTFDIEFRFLVPQHIYEPEDDTRIVITTLAAVEIQVSRATAPNVTIDAHRGEFEAVLRRIVTNFIAYSRYVKRNALLRGLGDLQTRELRNPEWTLDGVHVPPGTVFLEGSFPGRNCISEEDCDQLQSYLINPPELPLHEVLLAEARDARALRDTRRTVIDLAIVCEVLLKTKLFGRDHVASTVVEQLEDHNVLRATLKDLLAAAGRAFGSSLSETDSKAYNGILALYDVRNRIVHHGRAEKKVDGKRMPVESSDLSDWFTAVGVLGQWLDAGCATLVTGATPLPDV